MLQPDFYPAPTAVQTGRCGYLLPCRAPRCAGSRATIVLRKIDAAGRPVRQIELCDRYGEMRVLCNSTGEPEPELFANVTRALGSALE